MLQVATRTYTHSKVYCVASCCPCISQWVLPAAASQKQQRRMWMPDTRMPTSCTCPVPPPLTPPPLPAAAAEHTTCLHTAGKASSFVTGEFLSTLLSVVEADSALMVAGKNKIQGASKDNVATITKKDLFTSAVGGWDQARGRLD